MAKVSYCFTYDSMSLSQGRTVSSARWRPSQRAWRKMTHAAAVSRATCLTCCHATLLSTCAGWLGKWWPPSTCWRVTASVRTMLPPCCKCTIFESCSSPTTWRYIYTPTWSFQIHRVCAFTGHQNISNYIAKKVFARLHSHAHELEWHPVLNPKGLIWCWPALCSWNSFNSSEKAFHKISECVYGNFWTFFQKHTCEVRHWWWTKRLCSLTATCDWLQRNLQSLFLRGNLLFT